MSGLSEEGSGGSGGVFSGSSRGLGPSKDSRARSRLWLAELPGTRWAKRGGRPRTATPEAGAPDSFFLAAFARLVGGRFATDYSPRSLAGLSVMSFARRT